MRCDICICIKTECVHELQAHAVLLGGTRAWGQSDPTRTSGYKLALVSMRTALLWWKVHSLSRCRSLRRNRHLFEKCACIRTFTAFVITVRKPMMLLPERMWLLRSKPLWLPQRISPLLPLSMAPELYFGWQAAFRYLKLCSNCNPFRQQHDEGW